MNISERAAEGVTILDLTGRLTLGEPGIALRGKIRGLVQLGQKDILLNLGNVTYMDSSGIGELVSAYATVSGQGGRLKLLNLTKKLHELLAITKLLTVFETFENENHAIQSFRR